MATDPHDIRLNEEQRKLLAEKSDATGQSWAELLDELFSKLPRSKLEGNPKRTLYEALVERGMIGVLDDGPGDLSSNPKHMEGFRESRHEQGSD